MAGIELTGLFGDVVFLVMTVAFFGLKTGRDDGVNPVSADRKGCDFTIAVALIDVVILRENITCLILQNQIGIEIARDARQRNRDYIPGMSFKAV